MQIDEALDVLARRGGSVTFAPRPDGLATLTVTLGEGTRPRRRTVTCVPEGDDPLGMLVMDLIEQLGGDESGAPVRRRAKAR